MAINFPRRVNEFSTNLNHESVKHIIRRQLKLNDYPRTLISRINNRLGERRPNDKAMEASGMAEEHPTTKTFRSLTNIDGLTQQLTKTLRKEYPNVQVASKHARNVGSLLPLAKDKTLKDDQSNVVFKIGCAECNACYVGMTTTKLKTRIAGHRSNVKKLRTLRDAGYTNEDAAVCSIREKTALVNHAAAMEHTFKLEEAKIIDRTHKPTNLPILEGCHIYNTQNTVNKRTDTDNLHVAYA